MDRLTAENSTSFSSINSPSTTRFDSGTDHEEDDAYGDGINTEENLLERNIDNNGPVSDESLRRPQFLRTPMQHNSPRAYLLRCSIGLMLLSCVVYVLYDFSGNRNIETIMIASLDWTHAHPYKGIIAIIICYMIATVFFVPGSILTFGAGFAIGSVVDNLYICILLSVAAVFIGASIGSICSFLLGRYLFRDCVLQLAFSYPVFQAVERALETNGLKIMILLRLSPLIPFNALDYISGITSISLRDYVIALVAILPGAFVLCFAGASASSLSDRTSSTSTGVKIMTIVSGLLFGGYGVYLVSYYSKMELDRILNAESGIVSTEYNINGFAEDAHGNMIESYNVGDDDGGDDDDNDDDDGEVLSTELV